MARSAWCHFNLTYIETVCTRRKGSFNLRQETNNVTSPRPILGDPDWSAKVIEFRCTRQLIGFKDSARMANHHSSRLQPIQMERHSMSLDAIQGKSHGSDLQLLHRKNIMLKGSFPPVHPKMVWL